MIRIPNAKKKTNLNKVMILFLKGAGCDSVIDISYFFFPLEAGCFCQEKQEGV
jgi:hypothetical protein